MQAATQTVVKDTMSGLTLAGDPAFSIDGKAVTPSVAKGENGDGFTATFDQAFIKANSAKQVTVTYQAVVANAKRAAQASNTAAISTTFYDGTAASKTTVGWNLAADGSGVEYRAGESLYGRMTTATVDLYADWAGLQSTLPQAGGILHAAPVAGLSIMMLGVPLLILARRQHGV